MTACSRGRVYLIEFPIKLLRACFTNPASHRKPASNDPPFDLQPLRLSKKFGTNLLDERTDAGQLQIELLPAHLRQLQQVFDNGPHVLRRRGNSFQILLTLWAELCAVGIDDDSGEAVDMAKRRAQVMGNRITE